MSELQVVPADMAAASKETLSASEGAEGHGSADHLTTAAGAVPGADAVGHLSTLGSAWEDDVESWAADVAAFGRSISDTSDDVEQTDGGVGGIFGGLLGGLPGGDG